MFPFNLIFKVNNNLGAVINNLQMFRMVWIKGRLGFGKTSLAFMLAKILIDEGIAKGCISNCPNVLPTHISGYDDGTLYERVIVLDEGGLFLDARRSMSNPKEYGAFARKIGAIYLLPSVTPPDQRLRHMVIVPDHISLVSGETHWTCVLSDNEKDPTRIPFSVNVKKAYGLYSTSYMPSTDGGIRRRFELTFYKDTGQNFATAQFNNNIDMGLINMANGDNGQSQNIIEADNQVDMGKKEAPKLITASPTPTQAIDPLRLEEVGGLFD